MTKKVLAVLWAIISILLVISGVGNAITSYPESLFYACIGIAVLGLVSCIIEIIVFCASRDMKKRKQEKALSGMSAKTMINGYVQLQIGMLKADVIKLLGNPTGCRVQNGTETLTWKHSEFKGILRGGTIVRTIIVDFVDGKVIGYDSENMDRSRF